MPGPHRVLRHISVSVERTSRDSGVAGANGTGKDHVADRAARRRECAVGPHLVSAAGDRRADMGQWLTAEAPQPRPGDPWPYWSVAGFTWPRSGQDAAIPGSRHRAKCVKLTIALGLARQVWFAILDEPTNISICRRLNVWRRRSPTSQVRWRWLHTTTRLPVRLTNQTWHVESGHITAVS